MPHSHHNKLIYVKWFLWPYRMETYCGKYPELWHKRAALTWLYIYIYIHVLLANDFVFFCLFTDGTDGAEKWMPERTENDDRNCSSHWICPFPWLMDNWSVVWCVRWFNNILDTTMTFSRPCWDGQSWETDESTPLSHGENTHTHSTAQQTNHSLINDKFIWP